MFSRERGGWSAGKLAAGVAFPDIGDHDLAGNQIEENTRGVPNRRLAPCGRERRALTAPEVDHYDFLVITTYDSRCSDGRPPEAVETEALRQTVLIKIPRKRLDELLPEPLIAFLNGNAASSMMRTNQ